MRRVPAAILLIAMLVGCGDAAPTAPGGYSVEIPVESGAADRLGDVVRETRGPVALVAHDAAAAQRALAARDKAQRPDARVVVFADDAVVPPFADGGPDAVVTAAIAALANATADLTLLAVSGVATPAQVTVGARWHTRANRAAGGQSAPSPGEFGLAALRLQHPTVLDRRPQTDVVFRVGIVVSPNEPMRAQLATALAAACRGYPQLEARLGEDAGTFLAENVNALVLAGRGHAALAPLAREALANGVRVLGVASDLPSAAVQTTVVVEANTFGVAAAEAVRALLPQGGRVLEVGFRSTDPTHVARSSLLGKALATANGK